MYIRQGTALAAANDKDDIRIYLQDRADPNGPWDKLYNFGKGLYNTSIAITPYGSKRLYYQLTQGNFIEKLYKNAWEDGQFEYKSASWGCPIVAIVSDHPRVYHLSSTNHLMESVIFEMGPNSNCLDKEALDGSQLAVLEYDHNIRIYLQDEKEGTTISEYGYYHETGNWVSGRSVLPSENVNVLMSETSNSEL
ncbi:hypothetical protein C2857_003189 [Epichloe festucae Fl1]|uniref:Fucose-specific lectin n=1 Tax=Epichloe festucae (strain Fl1) TaxID=877507 RepID=A0A7U3Q1F7_EPIFF|nr:hypothetical protein C2857_003189 [Epichloe festucae Fl1]